MTATYWNTKTQFETASNTPEKIKQMISQVSSILIHFLDNLSYIYKSNGINFKVKHYHSVLLRMLSPFQLLTTYGFQDNSRLFIQANCQESRQSTTDQKFQGKATNVKKYKIMNQPEMHQGQEEEKSHLNEPNQISYSERLSSSNNKCVQVRQQKSNRFNPKYGREPLLGTQVQNKLRLWARERFYSSKQLSYKDIIEHAKQISNSSQFQASRGWLKRFLNRFPDVRKMIQIGRNVEAQETQKLDGKINLFTVRTQSESGNNYIKNDINNENQSQDRDWYRVQEDEIENENENNVERMNGNNEKTFNEQQQQSEQMQMPIRSEFRKINDSRVKLEKGYIKYPKKEAVYLSKRNDIYDQQ